MSKEHENIEIIEEIETVEEIKTIEDAGETKILESIEKAENAVAEEKDPQNVSETGGIHNWANFAALLTGAFHKACIRSHEIDNSEEFDEEEEEKFQDAEEREECKKIIRAAAIACGGVGTGLALLPLTDSAVITPIQVAMILKMGKVYDLDITESAALSVIASIGGAATGRCVSQVLVGWMPVIGNAINTATAAGVTTMIGNIALNRLSERAEVKWNIEHKSKKDKTDEVTA